MVEHRCYATASFGRYLFESPFAYKLLGIKQGEMLHGESHQKKTFDVGVVQRGNSSTLTSPL